VSNQLAVVKVTSLPLIFHNR